MRRILRRIPGARSLWRLLLRTNGAVQGRVRAVAATARSRRDRPRSPAAIDRPANWTVRRELLRLRLRALLLRRPMIDPRTDAVVTMTTHGTRIRRVHVAIESIARGTVLPRRLVLWIDDPQLFQRLPRSIRRLQRRGLDVRFTDNYGVHTKYYPYVLLHADDDVPLVTSDDDIVYPGDWLERMVAAVAETPGDIVCYRAHRIRIDDGALAPYQTWPPASGVEASFATFGTSVSGQAFPPRLLRIARAEGERFRELAPTADDVWLHALAVQHGIRARLLTGESLLFPFIPGTQKTGLYLVNGWAGQNDVQIAASYPPSAVAAIASDLERAR